jgi:hypothetical protein
VGLLALALAASAASAGITGDAIRINAWGDSGTGTWFLPTSSLVPDTSTGGQRWQTNRDIVIRDGAGSVLVTFSSLSVTFVEDPIITLNFLAVSGGLATNFTISSGVLGFTPGLYSAGASASITTTDADGNGAVTTGNFGGNTYQAQCNGTVIGTSTPGVTVGAFGSVTSSGTIGPANYFASSMQAKWDFTLSANDSASGTSVYHKTLVPSPSSLAVLGLGGLAAARRRRA